MRHTEVAKLSEERSMGREGGTHQVCLAGHTALYALKLWLLHPATISCILQCQVHACVVLGILMAFAFTGTTTATVLTRAIFSEGCKSVAAGMNPMDLRRGINSAVEKVLSYLKQHAKMISTTEEIAQVRSMPGHLGTQNTLTWQSLRH